MPDQFGWFKVNTVNPVHALCTCRWQIEELMPTYLAKKGKPVMSSKGSRPPPLIEAWTCFLRLSHQHPLISKRGYSPGSISQVVIHNFSSLFLNKVNRLSWKLENLFVISPVVYWTWMLTCDYGNGVGILWDPLRIGVWTYYW